MSLRDVAESVGVSRQIVGRLVRDRDLAFRQPEIPLRRTSWLAQLVGGFADQRVGTR